MLNTKLCLFIVLILFLPLNEILSQIEDDSPFLRWPVLIELGGGSGSGIILALDDFIILLTAKHVIFNPNSGKLNSAETVIFHYPHQPEITKARKLKIDLDGLNNNKFILQHTSLDIAVILLGVIKQDSSEIPFAYYLPELVKSEEGLSRLVILDQSSVLKFNEVKLGTEILIYGFPKGLGIQGQKEFDSYKPILRRGIVAGKNFDSKTFILDCPVYPGNSGGPIIIFNPADPGQSKIIGIVTQFIPYLEPQLNKSKKLKNYNLSNSGLSIGISIEAIAQIVENLKSHNPNE
jgi:hypothetical protein